MKIIAQQFLGGLGPLLPANRGAAAPRAALLPTAMITYICKQLCLDNYILQPIIQQQSCTVGITLSYSTDFALSNV